MIPLEELPYWICLAHIPKMKTVQKNGIVVSCFKEKIQLSTFFNEIDNWKNKFQIDDSSCGAIKVAAESMANLAFFVEDLLNQGVSIIPIIDSSYPESLKRNMKYNAPVVLYVKGDVSLLNKDCVSIVGSRNADGVSLEFTDNIAKACANQGYVIASGFAKGVDKQALESALSVDGESIIVLPQGISTATGSLKAYYKPIVDGRVIALSTFHPKSPWSVENAMSRNSIIYGLAQSIYVAQTDSKGGTWSGAINGLRKGQRIYVRKPSSDEKVANNLLIDKGCIPVDMDGHPICSTSVEEKPEAVESASLFSDADFQ